VGVLVLDVDAGINAIGNDAGAIAVGRGGRLSGDGGGEE